MGATPLEGLVIRRMDGPPPAGFDCGRDAQNAYLYERARDDLREHLSTTYLYFVHGMFAAYATVCMDALELGTREKGLRIRYRYIGAIKLAQLGVHLAFQGSGLGRLVVADIIAFAREEAERVACRYVTVDAQPDLTGWYARQGFRINKLMQRHRVEAAEKRGSREIAVSMRFDIFDGADPGP